jgi:hypothetical protein
MQKSELSASGKAPLLQAALLLSAVGVLIAVPPSLIERLPSVCLNRHIFGFCPACGSLRALVHFFHGDVARAIRFNINVLATAPVLILLLLAGLRRAVPGSPVPGNRD